MAECFKDQTDRVNTVTNCYLQALALEPNRPEAYFLMSQFYERSNSWPECYAWAKLGLNVEIDNLSYQDLEPILLVSNPMRIFNPLIFVYYIFDFKSAYFTEKLIFKLIGFFSFLSLSKKLNLIIQKLSKNNLSSNS